MLIRCKHERPGGSLVTFSYKGLPDYREYHFKATGPKGDDGKATGPHVAKVEHEEDIRTLLAIESAYEEYVEGAPLAPASKAESVTRSVLQPPRAKRDTAFLDKYDEKQLREWAADRFPAIKLDEAHSAEQLRTYLRSLIEKR